MKMAATATFLSVVIRKPHKARPGSSNVAMSPTVLRTFKPTWAATSSMQTPGGGLGKSCVQKKEIGVHAKMQTRTVATDQAVTYTMVARRPMAKARLISEKSRR